jgi:uncharacterized protein (DUF1499 family)
MNPKQKLSAYLLTSSLALGIIAVLIGIMAGMGSRWGWWNFRAGLSMLRWAVYVGLAGAAAAIAGLPLSGKLSWQKRMPGVLGLAMAAVLFWMLWSWWHTAQNVPPIHDITTDTENPPRFVSILPLRKDAANTAEYEGFELAAKQKKAYPDISPTVIPLPPARAFELCLKAARDMEWTIVDSNPADGRIEATDSTFWFGFKDDIVIRIRPSGQGSRIDVRSVSRVGRSDVGTNAKRIRGYLKKLHRFLA